jgi:orotidine-5'-phosphate decarboxylase
VRLECIPVAPLANDSRTRQDMTSLTQLRGADRLIVALDVPSVEAALRAVEQLDNVSFFKVGLQLFMTGGLPTLLQSLRAKRVFVDLKLPGDISNTIRAVMDMCIAHGVTFLTLSESMPPKAIRVAAETRNARQRCEPQLLTVPLLSSLDADDLAETTGTSDDLETYVLKRAKRALDAGCDGVIASGAAIQWCRTAFPHPTLIVSPGIRPDWATPDDHKRHTTPADAIRLGADYLVVGRPILRAPDPRAAADDVIREIDAALTSLVGE